MSSNLIGLEDATQRMLEAAGIGAPAPEPPPAPSPYKRPEVSMEMLREWVALEKRKGALETELEDTVKVRLAELSEILSEQWIQSGDGPKTVEGRTVRIKSDVEVSARDGNRAAVLDALRDICPDIVKEDFHPATLRAYVKDLVKGAREEAEMRGEKLMDLASAVPEPLARTLKISTVFKLTSTKAARSGI